MLLHRLQHLLSAVKRGVILGVKTLQVPVQLICGENAAIEVDDRGNECDQADIGLFFEPVGLNDLRGFVFLIQDAGEDVAV